MSETSGTNSTLLHRRMRTKTIAFTSLAELPAPSVSHCSVATAAKLTATAMHMSVLLGLRLTRPLTTRHSANRMPLRKHSRLLTQLPVLNAVGRFHNTYRHIAALQKVGKSVIPLIAVCSTCWRMMPQYIEVVSMPTQWQVLLPCSTALC